MSNFLEVAYKLEECAREIARHERIEFRAFSNYLEKLAGVMRKVNKALEGDISTEDGCRELSVFVTGHRCMEHMIEEAKKLLLEITSLINKQSK